MTLLRAFSTERRKVCPTFQGYISRSFVDLFYDFIGHLFANLRLCLFILPRALGFPQCLAYIRFNM